MKKIILSVCFILMFVSVTFAAEQLNLTTPITRPSTTSYKVESILFDWSNKVITIVVLDMQTGEKPVFSYYGTTAQNLMIALNKTNLSTISLQRRILERLVTDGKLSGTVSGTPD